MVEIQIRYDGELRCGATHGPSQAELATDAPVDNHGRGESFSPTDLVATALGTCMLTLMGITARRDGLDIAGTRLRVTKIMSAEPPRRITRLEVAFSMPEATLSGLDEQARAALQHAALTCPVRLSIHPAIEVPVDFPWTHAD